MTPLAGVRVVEVAMWGFVPSAGVVLADWGADVVKIEHPVHGDPMRGLVTGRHELGPGQANFMWEITNRGKRSIGIDLRNEAARRILEDLIRRCDVFLTSLLPDARRRVGIDEETVRDLNDRVVYALGSGMGPQGPESDRGGYDGTAYWSRSGAAHNVTPDESEYPCSMPAAAFGDITSGALLAGGVAAALLQRDRTGRGCIVDVSLLAAGMWAMSSEITGSSVLGKPFFRPDRARPSNPISATYRTADGRFLQLVMLEADRHWPDLCDRIGRPDLARDARFATAGLRQTNSAACAAELQNVFAQRPLAEWLVALGSATGAWAAVSAPHEVTHDRQALANCYVRPATTADGTEFPLIASPVQFDREAIDRGAAPEHGQHTELILLELGMTWDEIMVLKEQGAIS